MKPRPVVTASRIVFPRPAQRAHPYAHCPDEPALLREVGRDGGELLRMWQGRELQILKEESV